MLMNLRGLQEHFIISAHLLPIVCESQECILKISTKYLVLYP